MVASDPAEAILDADVDDGQVNGVATGGGVAVGVGVGGVDPPPPPPPPQAETNNASVASIAVLLSGRTITNIASGLVDYPQNARIT